MHFFHYLRVKSSSWYYTGSYNVVFCRLRNCDLCAIENQSQTKSYSTFHANDSVRAGNSLRFNSVDAVTQVVYWEIGILFRYLLMFF